MLVDMPANAIAYSRPGKEASQRPGQTADRSTSDCADTRDDGPDSATDSRASIGSSTSAEVSSHSAHAAANGSTDFLDSGYQEQFITAAAFRTYDLIHFFRLQLK